MRVYKLACYREEGSYLVEYSPIGIYFPSTGSASSPRNPTITEQQDRERAIEELL